MYRVLLVDDSRVMRSVLAGQLREAGLGESEFFEAGNGEEAISKLEELDFAVDAVFCDLYMPKMDGMEFLAELSEREALGRFPVVALTADARQEYGKEAVRNGAVALVAKPFTIAEIRNVLQQIFPVSVAADTVRQSNEA